MGNDGFRFHDVSEAGARKQDFWPTVIVPRAAIDANVGAA